MLTVWGIIKFESIRFLEMHFIRHVEFIALYYSTFCDIISSGVNHKVDGVALIESLFACAGIYAGLCAFQAR